jgi:hypothetical protein
MSAREFWIQVFLAAISGGRGVGPAADVADEAMEHFKRIGKSDPAW